MAVMLICLFFTSFSFSEDIHKIYVVPDQFMILNEYFQGYRVISVDIPRVWNQHEWVQAFEKFLDAIDVHHVRFPFDHCIHAVIYCNCSLWLKRLPFMVLFSFYILT